MPVMPAKKSPPVDLARMLPPSMRSAGTGSRFASVRMGLWVVFVAGFLVFEHGRPEVAVPIPESVTQTAAIPGATTADTGTTATDAGVSITDSGGHVWAGSVDGDKLTITSDGKTVYVVKAHGKGEWIVRSDAGVVVCKLKLKDGDKFNIYDADEKRMLHGKPKNGAIVVRGEDDAELKRFAGTMPIEKAAFLSLPIDDSARFVIDELHGRLGDGDSTE